MKIRLCYRIEKEAGWGEDEDGNPTEVYSCVKFDTNTYNVPKKKYKDIVEAFRKITASQTNIDEKYIIPITLNEYLDKTEEES